MLLPNSPVGSRSGIRIVVRLDLEVIEHNGHLLVGLGQEQVRTVRVRRIVGGIARTVQLAALLGAAHVGEAAGAVRRRRARNLVLRLEGVLALEAAALQLTGAEDHGQAGTLANHALRLVAAELVVELVVGIGRLLALQIDLQIAVRAVGSVR